MSKKLTVLLLSSSLLMACGRVPLERFDPAAALQASDPQTTEPGPDTSTDPDTDTSPDTDQSNQATIDRLSAKIDEFIADVEDELTPAADPNLSGIWLSVWATFGDETGMRNGQGYEASFEGFGFDVAYIDDDGAGTLFVYDCHLDEGHELFYDENDTLFNQELFGPDFGGQIVDSNHFDFGATEFTDSGIDPDTGDSFTATGIYLNKFTKLSNSYGDPVGTLTVTSTAGSVDLNIICTSYLEYEYTEAGNTDRFFAFIDEDYDLVEAYNSEDNISVSRNGENITMVAGDDDPDQVFVFEYSFN